MDKKHTNLVMVSISAIFFLLLVLTPLGITAQESGQQETEAVVIEVGTAFTYQGTLTDGGLPANGTYNLRFYLWSDESKTTLFGTYPSESTLSVEVIDGRFTAEIDFGEGAFNGEERWLELEVNGTLLSPLQQVTPSPYAIYAQTAPWSGLQGIPGNLAYGEFWSLTGNSGTTPGTDFLGTTDDTPLEFRVNNVRVLLLELNTSSPNFIAGYVGNGADSSTVGATISGGGRDMAINQVDGSYSTVGGGAGNTAAGYASTVSGGEANSANHSFAALVGGAQNLVCGDYAFLGGGQSNTACASHASIFGGYSNLITGTLGSISNYASISGGANNSVYGTYATVEGGNYNLLYGAYGTIAGGGPTDVGNPTTTNNRVYDDYGTISGGGSNTTGDENGDSTSNPAGTVSGGEGNTASGSYASVGGDGL